MKSEFMVRRDPNIARELFRCFRFGLVGLAAAMVHMGVAIFLNRVSNFSVLASNAVGFLIAFSVSFLGQYYWTFRSAASMRGAVSKYFLIAMMAFLVNNLVLVWLVEQNVVGDVEALLIAAAVIPAITYLLGRFWVF